MKILEANLNNMDLMIPIFVLMEMKKIVTVENLRQECLCKQHRTIIWI